MWIRTRLASASISLEALVPTNDNPTSMLENISLQLLPASERDHLDLDTGEIFQDYNYARLHKNEKKLIYASMIVRACHDESDFQYNRMHYMAAITGDDFAQPSLIMFNVFVAPTAFRELADNMRRGLFPETVTVELPPPSFFTTSATTKAPIEFGWEPDGSGLIWHNTESKIIAIKGVKFDYAVVRPRYHDKQVDRPLPMQFDTTADRINERIAQIQASLAQALKYLRWIALGIAALAIMMVITFIKRGALF